MGVLKESRVYTGCQKAGKPLSQRRYLYCVARLLPVAKTMAVSAAAHLDIPARSLIENGLL